MGNQLDATITAY